MEKLQSNAAEKLDIFQLEAKVRQARLEVQNMQQQHVQFGEELQQVRCQMQCEKDTAKKIKINYTAVQEEVEKEKLLIEDIQKASKDSEDQKGGHHNAVNTARNNNCTELAREKRTLRIDEKTILQAKHDQLCGEAQLNNINEKLSICQRVVLCLDDRVGIIRDALNDQQCYDQQLKAKIVLLANDFERLQHEEQQCKHDVDNLTTQKATVSQESLDLQLKITCAENVMFKLQYDTGEKRKDLHELVGHRQKLWQKSHCLKDELIKKKQELEEEQQGSPCVQCSA